MLPRNCFSPVASHRSAIRTFRTGWESARPACITISRPRKELLHALTQRYRAKQRKRLAELDDQYESPADRLDAYLAMMAQVAHSGNKICPLGTLSAEFNVIPQKVQEDIRELFDFAKSWLTGVLAEGSERGELAFDGAASERAVLIMSAVQGALQIARATGPKGIQYSDEPDPARVETKKVR